jgi:hypothetical protein
VGQEDKLTTGLQSNCRNGSGGPDAWSALKALKGFRSAPTATGFWQALATRACHTNSSKFKTAAGTVSWRHTHVARAKAAIADRFGVVDLASLKGSARQAQGHSLIFMKAA